MLLEESQKQLYLLFLTFISFLHLVANLVLSSISIKNATEESMKMARVSLGSEVILQTDMEKIRDEFMNRIVNIILNRSIGNFSRRHLQNR